jgi:molybdopterin/thiamine biosynthesis adenylyltransferase
MTKGLNECEKIRYNRQIIFSGIGLDGQIKLKNSKVFIAGAGGLGSPISFYLAVAGVGHITIVDKDKVELSNLNRQILHWDDDIKKAKATSAKEKLKSVNPDIIIEAKSVEIKEDNILDLLEKSSLILDAMDNFSTRFVLNKAALKLKIPFIHGGVWGFEGRVTTIIPYKTACLRCFTKTLPPEEIFPVIGVTPGIIGVIQAAEAIKYITGFGKLLENRLLIFDGELLKFHEIIIEKDPECPECSVNNAK